MTKVMIYDYNYDMMEPAIDSIEEKLNSLDTVECRIYLDSEQRKRLEEGTIADRPCFPEKMQKEFIEEFKRYLPDVLLIHAGTEGQYLVFGSFSRDFPNTRIGLLSFSPQHYERRRNISILNYQDLEGIERFVVEKVS